MLGILPGLATWMLALAAKAEGATSLFFGTRRGPAKERKNDVEPKATHTELELKLESKVDW